MPSFRSRSCPFHLLPRYFTDDRGNRLMHRRILEIGTPVALLRTGVLMHGQKLETLCTWLAE